MEAQIFAITETSGFFDRLDLYYSRAVGEISNKETFRNLLQKYAIPSNSGTRYRCFTPPRIAILS